MSDKSWLVFSEEVADAMATGKPVVALESTIISHGMPWPKNLSCARLLEETVREEGAVPATIALMNGAIHVGLSAAELEELASGQGTLKVSRRDLAWVLSSKKMGATTVAATMICAEMAGIKVFATGGIGGVHREGHLTMDISADLLELAKTDVAVVCAGAKAILDIGRTLEFLETHGVPVVGYQTDAFPAFYTRDSGYGVSARCDSAMDVAKLLHTKWSLNLKGGVIVGNPVPEAAAMDDRMIDQAIEQALKEANDAGISGKDVTPFLLGRVKELTEGDSLETNIALVKNNAAVASKIAVALTSLTSN